MKNRLLMLGVILAVFGSSSLRADEVRAKEVCQKLTTCTLKMFDNDDVPEQMKQLVMAQLDQCAATFKSKEKELIDAGLEDQANACADDMIDMPCEQLMTPNGANKSTACNEFQKAAEKAGIKDV